MNTKLQGNVGLGQAIAYYTSLGYVVSLPLNDSQKYDLIYDDGKLWRVQVKTSFHKAPSGSFIVQLRQKGGSSRSKLVRLFDPKSADFIFVFCEDGTRYLIPCSTVKCTSDMTLGPKYAKYQLT